VVVVGNVQLRKGRSLVTQFTKGVPKTFDKAYFLHGKR